MSKNLETFLLIVGASAPFGAFIVFFLTRLLNSRKEIWQIQSKNERQDERIADLEEKFEQIERWYNNDNRN